MTNDLEVRAATPADRGAAIRLLTAQLLENGLPADAEGIARAVELALAPGSAAWLAVAQLHGLPAGILLANPIVSVEKGGGVLWIEELYVVPERRRRGVARALLAFAVDEARRFGIASVELEVVQGMEAAHALYRALGFRTLERQRYSLDL
jgi:GNAT superfamily N-acetyltransferase